MTEHRADVVIVGAGPAGIAAARSAAACKRRVIVIDDNPAIGGQIWRGEPMRLEHANIQCISSASVVDVICERTLLVERANRQAECVSFERLILAAGARERFLPFPGWTLPGVTGAGALQAMVKGGLPIQGKRIVVAGSGPLLLAVAAYLRKRGARMVLVAEQAPASRLMRFALSLSGNPAKLLQAYKLRRALAGVPYAASTWPMEAAGQERLKRVLLRSPRGAISIACDYLSCGFGLVPNTELADILTCDVREGFVAVDDFQRTTRPNVYAAGEITGIGGLELSLLEGSVAGFTAAGHEIDARRLFKRKAQARRFAEALATAFELRSELRELADAHTIVCRCEDVTYGQLVPHRAWRSAKLQTRCGMGSCQGRVCGSALEFLFNWKTDSTRIPIFPSSIATLTIPREVTK